MGRIYKPKHLVPVYRLSPRVRARLVRLVGEELHALAPDLHPLAQAEREADAKVFMAEVHLAGLPPTERKRVVQALHQVADTGDSEGAYDLVDGLARRGHTRWAVVKPRASHYLQRHTERVAKRLARRS